MGGGANLRVVGPQPAPGQGLRDHRHVRPHDGPPRLRPAPRATARKSLKPISSFADGLLTPPIDANMCIKMLEPAFKERRENRKIMAVMCVEHDRRMFIQQGAFTIHSYTGALNQRPGNSRYLVSLIIPAQA